VTKYLKTVSLVVLFAVVCGTAGRAQEKGADRPQTMTPIKVQVVISRLQGDKKISSLPYTLSVNVPKEEAHAGKATLRMGTKVPVATTVPPLVPGPGGQTISAGPTSFSYQDVGTNIDCLAFSADGGRFRIELTIEDSSILQDANKAGDRPSFRSIRASDSMVLKDGEIGQFTVATDKVTGETTKVDVTLTILK
jgi:hypothetical protein